MVFLEYWIPCPLSLTQDKQIMTGNAMFQKISYLWILDQRCKSSQFQSPCCLQYLLFPWIFKICISFFKKKRFLLQLFIMLYHFCHQRLKLQLLKCIAFEEQLLHFYNFCPWIAMSSYLYKVWEDRKTEWIQNFSAF